jgi:hypothetical protein
MNKVITLIFIFAAAFFSLGSALADQAKNVDVNKDGKPDVTYYKSGERFAKIEADTNYDGKPDVVVYVEDGKFKSAEVDSDYNGKTDKKFSDPTQFKKWVNENRPDFNDSLGWDDYSRTISKVFWQPGGNKQ